MFVSTLSNPKQNRLLATLPDSDYGRLLPDLERITMPLGWSVFDAAIPGSYVYFPSTAVVSMLHTMDNDIDKRAEIIFAGRESMIGISLFMESEKSLRQGVVHIAGDGYRVKANVLKSEFALGSGFQHLALRYAKSVSAQLAQTAECGRQHLAEQQLSRWLLLYSDSCANTQLPMTPVLIANMLRRDGVAQAVETLETAGAIHYARGHITILDRSKLQQYGCYCYGAVKSELACLLLDRREVAKVAGGRDQSEANPPPGSRSAS